MYRIVQAVAYLIVLIVTYRIVLFVAYRIVFNIVVLVSKLLKLSRIIPI